MVIKLLCTWMLKSTNKITVLVQSYVSMDPQTIENDSFVRYKCDLGFFLLKQGIWLLELILILSHD